MGIIVEASDLECINNCNSSKVLTEDEIGAVVANALFLLCFVCPIGILANIVTFYVLVQNEMPKAFKGFLLSLTASDLIIVVSFLFSMIVYILQPWSTLYYVLNIIGRIGRGCSGWFRVLLTVEGYLSVCHPLSHKSTWTQMKFCSANVVAISLAVAFSIPHMSTLLNTRFEGLWNKYRLTVQIVEFLITSVVVIVLNICIVNEIKRVRERRKTILSSLKADFSLTNLMKGIVVIHICVFVLPNLVLSAFLCFGYTNSTMSVFNVVMPTLVLNSSSNWIVYCGMSAKLRTQYYEMLGCSCCRKTINEAENSTRTATTRTIPNAYLGVNF